MSRIAKTPIEVPGGVEVRIVNSGTDRTIIAKGPKGENSFGLLPGIDVVEADGIINISITNERDQSDRKIVSLSGTVRAMVYNLIHGVNEGFEKNLSIVGVGYRANAQGKNLNLSLGFSHPVVYQPPVGVTVETPSQTEIIVRGTNKQQVGQTAAEIRAYRPPEPYKGKGIRYRDEHVRRKQAKKK